MLLATHWERMSMVRIRGFSVQHLFRFIWSHPQDELRAHLLPPVVFAQPCWTLQELENANPYFKFDTGGGQVGLEVLQHGPNEDLGTVLRLHDHVFQFRSC